MGTTADLPEKKRRGAKEAERILGKTRWLRPRRMARTARRVEYPMDLAAGEQRQLAERLAKLEREVEALKAKERVMHLVETGHWGAARTELEAAGPAPELEGLRKVLEPARVTIAGPASGKGLASTRRWLAANREAYRGKWVALRNGELVDSDRSHAALHDRLATQGDPAGLLVIKV